MKMRKFCCVGAKGFCLALLAGLFSCSWKEYFAVYNDCDESIEISYTLYKTTGISLFHNAPMLYRQSGNGDINWNEPLSYADADPGTENVRVSLPAHSVLIFGELDNDHYYNKDQHFINDRKFNLKSFEMKISGIVRPVPLKDFDTYFRKKDGVVAWRVLIKFSNF